MQSIDTLPLGIQYRGLDQQLERIFQLFEPSVNIRMLVISSVPLLRKNPTSLRDTDRVRT